MTTPAAPLTAEEIDLFTEYSSERARQDAAKPSRDKKYDTAYDHLARRAAATITALTEENARLREERDEWKAEALKKVAAENLFQTIRAEKAEARIAELEAALAKSA